MRTQDQRLRIINGVHNSLKDRKEKLLYIGVNAPYGYKLNDKKLIIDENVYFVVYTIYDLYDKGFSFSKISDYLNERNIVNPSTYKMTKEYIYPIDNDIHKKWDRSCVRKIIENKVYSGRYAYSESITHECIINDELFDKVKKIREEKRNYNGNDFFYYNGNEFIGKIICGECGRNFTLTNSKCKAGVVRYLRCASYDKRNDHKCFCSNNIGIRYDDLKDILKIYIEKEIFSDLDFLSLKEDYAKNLKNEKLNIKRNNIKKEIVILKKLIEKNTVPLSSNNSVIDSYNENLYKKKDELYYKRLEELEESLKRLNSFSRSKNIDKNDLFVDKFIIDLFVDNIKVFNINNSVRNLEINLKI